MGDKQKKVISYFDRTASCKKGNKQKRSSAISSPEMKRPEMNRPEMNGPRDELSEMNRPEMKRPEMNRPNIMSI